MSDPAMINRWRRIDTDPPPECDHEELVLAIAEPREGSGTRIVQRVTVRDVRSDPATFPYWAAWPIPLRKEAPGIPPNSTLGPLRLSDLRAAADADALHTPGSGQNDRSRRIRRAVGGLVVKRTTIAQAAVEHLRENGMNTVMWGDMRLLHEICERAGRPHRGMDTEKPILDAVDRSPLFVKHYVIVHRPRGFLPRGSASCATSPSPTPGRTTVPDNVLAPAPALLAMLGSIIVHADEALAPHGHDLDRRAFTALLHDTEVPRWFAEMRELVLLPVKRRAAAGGDRG